ncbi:MAG: SDR family oxidoreductase [Planctomycetes bacterium]|nr:SDR family oxidoreductase [Planctomycetota bacterium]
MVLPADLADRTVVITGASRGIGAGVARDLTARGLRLGLCARSMPALADAPRLVAAQVDVRDGEAVERFARQVEERLGPIDLWVNNAAVLEPVGPLRDLETEAVRAHLDVNVLGVLHGARAYARHLARVGRPGVLVNVSSGAARRAVAGWSAYCAAKAAVERLTEVLALEEGPRGLRAHAVSPGVVDTDMQRAIRATPEERFPDVERFRAMAREGRFSSVEHVTRHLLALAFDPDDPARREVLVSFPPERP